MPNRTQSRLIVVVLLLQLFQACRKDTLHSPLQVNQLKTWEVFELSLGEGPKMSNPYVEGLKDGLTYETVTFKGISGRGEGKKIIIPAF